MIAVFSGAAWANDAWGRYWSWDPKETWSLITWSVYAIYLHTKTIWKRLALGLGIKKLEPSTEGFSYMPKMWLTRLVVKKPDGKVMDAALWVNKPFRTGCLTLYQMGYEQKINLRVNGIWK